MDAPAPPIADRAAAPSGAVLVPPGAARPGRYVVTRRVPIMPVHERTIVLRHPETGKVLRDEQGRPRKRTLRVDEAALRAIAADANDRFDRGHPCPISIGHFQLHEPDETKQPEIIGHMSNHDVGPITDGAGKVVDPKPHLHADLHVFADREEERKGYPRRSTEIDPDFAEPARSTLDSLALLRRHPEHEMGLLTYQRDPTDVGGSFLADEPPPADAPEAPEPGEDTTMDENLLQQLGELIDQKLAANNEAIMHALAEALDGGEAGGEEAPAEEPAAPIQNEAAVPSGDNTFAPEMVPEKEEDEVQNCDGDRKLQYQRAVASSPAVLALKRQVDALTAQNKALTDRLEENEDYVGDMLVQNCRDTIAKELDALEGDGVQFNREEEAAELLELAGDPARMRKHIDRMRVQYQRLPRGRSFVDVASPKAKSGRPLRDAAEMNKIVALAGRHGLDFSAAKEKYLAGELA